MDEELLEPLEPQAARIVHHGDGDTADDSGASVHIAPFLRQYDKGASEGGAMAGQKRQMVLDVREPAQT